MVKKTKEKLKPFPWKFLAVSKRAIIPALLDCINGGYYTYKIAEVGDGIFVFSRKCRNGKEFYHNKYWWSYAGTIKLNHLYGKLHTMARIEIENHNEQLEQEALNKKLEEYDV